MSLSRHHKSDERAYLREWIESLLIGSPNPSMQYHSTAFHFIFLLCHKIKSQSTTKPVLFEISIGLAVSHILYIFYHPVKRKDVTFFTQLI